MGSAGNDYINGALSDNGRALSDNGRMTYQTLDSIDGGLGTDTLFVEMSSTSASVSLTPTRTSNVELFEISNVGTINTATLNLSQVSGVEGVTVAGSSARTDVTNIGNAQVALASTGTTADVNFTILNSALSGSDTVNLSVDGHDGHTGAIAINSTGTNDIEGLSLEATGADSTISTLTVGDSAGDTMTSMTVSGEAALTITNALNANVTSVDASATTGGVTLGMGAGNVTVLGGEGNDSLTFGTTAGNVSVVGGLGNDTFTFAGAATLTTADTVTGGDGFDTLAGLSAALTGYFKPATATITGIERITVTDALAGALTTSNVQTGVTEVQLNNATGSNTVTFDTGVASTLRLNAAAAGTIAVASAGAATTDSVTIKNATVSTDVFDGQAVTATGVETLTLDGGTTTTRVQQDVTKIGATSGTTAVKFVGNNAFALTGAVTAGSIDASGLTGTATLTMAAGQVGVTSITGSANADTLIGRAALATTISGGAGNDTITGGTAADSLVGGDGADSITAGGGNDSVSAGAGNDTVVTTGALTNLMILDGGDGVDTLSIDTQSTVGLANTTNFETLLVAGAITQGMEVFTGSTFTRIDLNGAGATTINNASSSVATLRIDDGATNVAFARLVNTSTDTLTVGARESENTGVTLLTVNNEDTLNIGQGAIVNPALTFTITDLDAIDVDTINVTGAQATVLRIRADGAATGFGAGTTARTITVDASAATGNVDYDSSLSTSTLYTQTVTGSLTANNTLIGGGGADSITGGNGTNVITGGGGNDTLTGGTSSDTLAGGLGADSIVGGSGTDTYSAAGTNGVADGGLINSIGQVINLGATTLTDAAINAATNGVLAANDGVLAATLSTSGVVTNQAAYLYTASTGGTGGVAFIDTLSSIENVTGSAGRDYIVGSSASNTITGAAGADVMTGGAGAAVADRFTVAADSSVASTAGLLAAATYAANDTMIFGNDLDVITDFNAAVDTLDVTTANVNAVTLIGKTAAGNAAYNGVTYFASGTSVQSTGTFTILADGSGADTIIFIGTSNTSFTASGVAGANTSAVVLVGVDSDNLAAANFV